MSASFRNPSIRELRPLLASRCLGAFANHFLLFAIPLLVFKITQDVGWSGRAYVIEWAARLTSLLVAGYVVQRIGVWRPMLAGDAIRALACVAAVGMLTATGSVAALILLAMVNGFLFDTSFIAVETIAQRRARPADLPHLQAVIQAIDQTALVGAPVLAAILVAVAPAETIILVAAGCYSVSLGFIVLQRLQPGEPMPVARTPGVVLNGFRVIRQRPRLIRLILETNAINLVLGAVMVVNPAMVTGVFGRSDSVLAASNLVFGVVGILCVAASPWLLRRLGARLGPLTVAAGAAAGIAVAVLPASLVVYILLAAAIVGLDSAFSVHLRVERARAVPAALFGRVIAPMMLFNALAFPVSGALVAGLSDRVGTPVTLGIIGILSVALLLASRAVAVRPGPDAEPTPAGDLATSGGRAIEAS